MAQVTFNENKTRKVPITRNSLFYDEKSYMYEVDMGKQYVEMDMGQTVVLYQVDTNNLQSDSVYGETNPSNIAYKTPVEIPCVYEIEDPELKSYDKSKNLGTYMKTGKLKIGVYQATLDELGVDISKGDYIGIQVTEEHMEFFCVNNDGKNNYDNNHTMFGVKPFYRSITANPVDKSEFSA